MALTPGSRLGVYEVTGQIGQGGMGEVYRATDTRLKRDVALKILPDAFADDPERLARFTREAQTLASLNHPHIAAIYGLEESGGTRALVMELVEGEDLSVRIARGPIPLDEALPIARQIAEALEAAHGQGIIHRDLKPANVKVRSDGTVKVLDFGLAKALDPAPGIGDRGAGQVADSPTITTPAMTMRGVIMGTAAYMSPEQAKGKPLDKRADVWAFGCVLYEMITGRRVFDAEDVSETLAAVLRAEPEWSAIPLSTAPGVTRLIKRCLERDPRRRVADMSTVRFVLDEPGALAESVAPAAAATPTKSRLLIPMVAALVAVAGAAGYWASRWTEPAGPAPVTRFVIAPPDGQTIVTTRAAIAISPDGSQVAWADAGNLVIRRLAEFQPRVLPIGSRVTSPAYSPDGEWIAFYSSSETAIKKVSVSAGTVLRVCDIVGVRYLTWDTSALLASTVGGDIVRCSPSGGAAEVLVKAEEGRAVLGPRLLPGGEAVMFTQTDLQKGTANWETAQIVVQSLRTGERKIVVTGGHDGRFGNGHLFYVAGGILFAVPFDPVKQQVGGAPVPIIEGVLRAGGIAQLAISTTGVMAYLPGPTSTKSAGAIGIAARSGAITRLPIPDGPYQHVRVSRDGVAIGSDDGKQAIVWIYKLGGTAALQRLTLDGNNRFPIWSPDGASVAFQSDRGNAPGIYRQRVDGTGGVERLTSAAADETHIPESWSPDGRVISYTVVKEQNYSLRILTLANKQSEAFAGVTSKEPISSVFSPDGKWLAYAGAPGDDITMPDRGVFVRPFPSGSAVYQAPRQLVDFSPVWTPDGSELAFVTSGSSGQMAAMRLNISGGISFGPPVVFPALLNGDRLSGQPRGFDIMPDGRFIGVFSPSADGTSRMEIRVVLNAFEVLKQPALAK